MSVSAEDVNPGAASLLKEGAARDEHRLFGLPQLEVEVVGLTAADIRGPFVSEDEVCAELALTDFGIDFAKGEKKRPLSISPRGGEGFISCGILVWGFVALPLRGERREGPVAVSPARTRSM